MIDDFVKAKVWKGSPQPFAHLKRDGYRVRLQCVETGVVQVLTRELDLTEYLNHLDWFRSCRMRMSPGDVLEAELWKYDVRASSIITHIKARDPLELGVFAVPSMKWNADLDEVSAYVRERIRVPFLDYWRTDQFDWKEMQPFAWSDMKALPPNVEGWVFKSANMLDWQKWKPTKTLDAIVVDLEPGNGKYEGQCGALIVALRDASGERERIIANVSGFDDDTRNAINESCIGRVVEVAYQYVGNGGKLRHPRFVRWRDDKRETECEFTQDDDFEENRPPTVNGGERRATGPTVGPEPAPGP